MTRFGPIESTICISAIIHGLWLIFPEWRTATGEAIGPAGHIVESVIGTGLIVVALAHLVAMFNDLNKLRRNTAFIKFMLWLFVAWIAFISTAATSIVWIAYLTIAFVEGLVYLNVSLGGEEL